MLGGLICELVLAGALAGLAIFDEWGMIALDRGERHPSPRRDPRASCADLRHRLQPEPRAAKRRTLSRMTGEQKAERAREQPRARSRRHQAKKRAQKAAAERQPRGRRIEARQA
jgi:hypothetical protein